MLSIARTCVVPSLSLVLFATGCFPGPLELGAEVDAQATTDSAATIDDSFIANTDVATEPDADVTSISDTPITTDVEAADADVPTDASVVLDTDTTSALNACGGEATLIGGEPGTLCGDCGDGTWSCVDGDHTTCTGASTLNACGGCGPIEPALESACDTCGVVKCDPTGGTAAVCVEPEGGCLVPLSCADLGCATQGRACSEAHDAVDATCGDCLATHVLVGSSCLLRLSPPAGVTGTNDRSNDVELQWQAVASASGYRVYRCDVPTCSEADWEELTTDPISATIFDDTTALAPSSPSAPDTVAASADQADVVSISWDAVVAPLAPAYRYRVVSVGLAGTSTPSAVVSGHRAERPVIGYELQLDDAAWSTVYGGLVTTATDATAPPPTLIPGTVSASLGTFPDHVHVSVAGAAPLAGPDRHYRVRAITDYGPATASSVASGHRQAGALGYQWERSAAADAADFSALTGATTTSYDDDEAPADGEIRWYRVVVSAAGASPVTGAPQSGARQPPPGVPGGVTASSDRPDDVLVSWQPVSGALGYHVYRDGTRLTSGSGVTATSYNDVDAPGSTTGWGAPTSVAATSNNTIQVTVSWTAPQVPRGVNVRYTVSAVNAAGEGAQSSSATGRRTERPLAGYEVEVTPSGGSAAWNVTGSTSTSWAHLAAPAGVITPGSLSASAGEHRAYVALTSSGASVAVGAPVTYRVRGVLDAGGYTPVSSAASGHRTTGALTRQWRRSDGDAASNFVNLSGVTAASFNDTTAPSDGAKRYYDLILSATGTTSVTVPARQGWRLAFVEVDGGDRFTCALTSAGIVWCWGRNEDGELGRGTSGDPLGVAPVTMPAGRTFTDIAAGSSHICALDDAKHVWCWGDNSAGQLGVGTVVDMRVPTAVTGLEDNVTSLACAAGSTCSSTNAGEVWCWGGYSLGSGAANDDVALIPVQVKTSSTAALSGVISVGAGGSTACARKLSSTYCWGLNSYGQLLGIAVANHVPFAMLAPGVSSSGSIDAGYYHSCVISSGVVRCSGWNIGGALGNGTTTGSTTLVNVVGISTAVEVSLSGGASCARLASGEVDCWGPDVAGQRGDGEGATAFTAAPSIALLPGPATDIGMGYTHECAIVDHEVFCWGDMPLASDGTVSRAFTPVAVVLP